MFMRNIQVNVESHNNVMKGWKKIINLCVCVCVVRLCPTLCDPMDCSLPGSSVCRILQARILEWVAVPFPEDLPDPGIEPDIAGRFFTI